MNVAVTMSSEVSVCLSVCAPSFESLDLESRVVELAFENLGRLAQWSTF